MRELHVVALSEDGRSVLLATTKNASSGAFRLKLEGKLTAALRGDLPRPGEDVRAASVTPKEIQARMRAGESAEQIAAEAGVPVSRIERFAGPVLSERERIIEEARAAFLSRGRLGPSLLPLGDAVDAVLAETPSLRGDTVTWTARRLDSGHWLVQVSYVARARTRTGSWVYDPHTRSIVPSDQPSAVMGHTGEDATARKPARGVATPVARKPARAAARKKPARKAAARPATKAPARPAAKPAAKPVARPAAKPAAKPAARPAAKAAPKPAAKPAAKAARPAAKPAAKATKATPRRVAKPKAAPVRTATPAAAERAAEKLAAAMVAAAEEPTAVETFEPVAPAAQAPPPPAPAPEPEPVEEVAAATPEPEDVEPEQERPPLRVVPAPPAELVPTPVPKRRAAGERAHVPDWADVLFGAAPHKDRKDG